MTVSAWLWARELEGGGCFWREFIDDTFLCFKDEEDHCMRCYQRETRKT
jgi:7-cyano-7-deazaguanine synthase in queuosine biosynthesis